MLSNGGSPTSVPSASALGCFTQATRRHALASFFAMFRDERARGLAVKLTSPGVVSQFENPAC